MEGGFSRTTKGTGVSSSSASTAGARAPRKRSSISKVAQESLGDFDPRKSAGFKWNFSSSVVASGGRYSGKLGGNYTVDTTSYLNIGCPTPASAARFQFAVPKSVPNPKLVEGSALARSRIPTPTGRASYVNKDVRAMRGVMPNRTIVLSKTRPPPKTASMGMSKQTQRLHGSSTNLSSAVGSTANKFQNQALKRSTSIESFYTSNNFTPSTMRRLSGIGTLTGKKVLFCSKSAENIHRNYSTEPIQKVLKVPASADKRMLNNMNFMVVEFLKEFGYLNITTAATLAKITVAEYFTVCQFVIKQIGCPNFKGTKVDEFIPQLLEVASLLKYPGTLTKSVLKTANTPHSWSAAVTFLLWLCCRIHIIRTPRIFGSSVSGIAVLGGDSNEQRFTEFVSDSFRRMFFKTLSGLDPDLEKEMEEYSKNLMDAFLFNPDETLKSLSDKLKRNEEVLDAKEAIVDPCSDVLKNIDAGNKKLEELALVKTEQSALLSKFSDCEHLESQICTLHKKICAQTENLEKLRLQIEQQPLNLTDAKLYSVEIEHMGKQHQSLAEVIEVMKNKLKIKQQGNTNCDDNFYTICKRFRVVDDFNEYIKSFEKLKLVTNMETIKRNPFNQKQFKSWLKDVRSVLRTTERVLGNLKLEIEQTWKSESELSFIQVKEQIERCQAEILSTEEEIAAVKEGTNQTRSRLQKNEAAAYQKHNELVTKMRNLVTENKIREEEIEVLKKEYSSLEEKMKLLVAEEQISSDNIVAIYVKKETEDLEYKGAALIKRDEMFMEIRNSYLEAFGVDMFNLPDEAYVDSQENENLADDH